jgi:hypothetical protein
MKAALRVGSIVKNKIEEIGHGEMERQQKQSREGELKEMVDDEVMSNRLEEEAEPQKESDDSAASPTSSRQMEV